MQKSDNSDNPFLIGKYAGSKYFCEREKETEKLIDALENGCDVTMMGPLGIGKTWLLQHTFSIIRDKDPKATCLYVDLSSTQSVNDFTEALMNAILAEIHSSIKDRLKVAKGFNVCKPEIYVNPETGEETIKLNVIPEAEALMVKSALNTLPYFCKDGNRVYVAFDEFQKVTEYPQMHIEALIRSYVNSMPRVNFIFAGSNEDTLRDMFFQTSRPFFCSTQIMHLRPLDKDIYFAYCRDAFSDKGILLEQKVFDYMYKKVSGNTKCLQCWMLRLYQNTCLPTKRIRRTEAKAALAEILVEKKTDTKDTNI